MYATIDDVKWFVWSQYADERIQSLLDMTEDDITFVVWDISYWVKTSQFEICRIYDKTLYFDNIQIEEILQINDKDYTNKYEVMKPQRRRVWIENFHNYVDLDQKVFTVKYLSWYQTIPADLVMAHALIVSDMLSTWGGREISKYKMWPRTVEYESWASSPYVARVNKILNRYRLFRV